MRSCTALSQRHFIKAVKLKDYYSWMSVETVRSISTTQRHLFSSVQSRPGVDVSDDDPPVAAPRTKKRNPTLKCEPIYQPQRLAELTVIARFYHRVLESFPDGIQMAFAYGSGVYQQVGHLDMSQNMLDFIIVVDDPLAWHRENLKRNSCHYSFCKYTGCRGVAYMQDHLGAGVYFNTLIPFEDRFIKYGVISTERLITDLLDWDTLYVSGRLHKPVRLLVLPQNQELMDAMQMNLNNAVHAALLLLPETFCEETLYTTLAGLSYTGDFRMIVGEDRNKVANIVRPNMIHFRRLFESIIEANEHVYWHQSQGRLEQHPSYTTRFHHLQLLPKTILLMLQEMRTYPGAHPDLEEVLQVYAHDSHCDDAVIKCITAIVARSSWTQSLKTVLSAGMQKSVIYSMKKVVKMIRSGAKRQEDL